MAIGEPEPEPTRRIEIVDWEDLFARNDGDESVIPGVAYRGRWTAIAAPAKAGKSTVFLGLAVAAAQMGLIVLYLDAEMGRADILDRLEEWMQLKPADLTNLHYSDLPPKLDTVEGTGILRDTVLDLKPDLVVIDGLNGVVNGDENDNPTWRYFYEWAVAPMKALNIAILSIDNTGHTDKNRPRGSSVKLDKPDAIIALERTDEGCKLTANYRRTSAYPQEQHFVVSHASEEGPPMTVTAVASTHPTGTADIVKLLDKLGAPVDIGIKAARRLVRESGHQGRNQTIDAAVKSRRLSVPAFSGTLQESPESGGCPDGVSTCSTPPSGTPGHLELETDPEDPFA